MGRIQVFCTTYFEYFEFLYSIPNRWIASLPLALSFCSHENLLSWWCIHTFSLKNEAWLCERVCVCVYICWQHFELSAVFSNFKKKWGGNQYFGYNLPSGTLPTQHKKLLHCDDVSSFSLMKVPLSLLWLMIILPLEFTAES